MQLGKEQLHVSDMGTIYKGFLSNKEWWIKEGVAKCIALTSKYWIINKKEFTVSQSNLK